MSLKIHVEKVLEGFNLKIDLETEDVVTGLLGYSGSGKSITLKMIAGIILPDRGMITLNNRGSLIRGVGLILNHKSGM